MAERRPDLAAGRGKKTRRATRFVDRGEEVYAVAGGFEILLGPKDRVRKAMQAYLDAEERRPPCG